MTLKNQVAAKDIQISTLKRELAQAKKEVEDKRLSGNQLLKLMAIFNAAGLVTNAQITAAHSLINSEE